MLDGLEEFLAAGLTLGLRTAVNLETRAYVREYPDADISSPGEAGVAYLMGAGFARMPAPGSEQAAGLAGYRDRARERNVALIQRINPHLPDIALDYERDVLPLTPAGAATERHIIAAYVNRAQDAFQSPDGPAEFWGHVLERDFEEARVLLADHPALEELVRARLVKRGGLGYEQPSVDTFPQADDFFAWTASCGAIPMIAWLDGTSRGEENGEAFLECMMSKGGAALNVIPDRNWNVSDPEQQRVKAAKLAEIMALAEDKGLPVNAGTEMNKLGLPFVDDLDCGALRPFKDAFLRGARVMVGHTVLLRYAGLSYAGKRASAEFPAVRARNEFFERVGALPPLTAGQAAALENMGEEKALGWFWERAG